VETGLWHGYLGTAKRKGRTTDKPNLLLPRHIPTLPIAASGLRNLNDCSQSDPAFGARPQQYLVWLAACGLGAATELSWFDDGNRPLAGIRGYR